MTTNTGDFYIEALKRLALRVSDGTEGVAKATGLSAAYLSQIITGVTHPSGRPRGVGPRVRDALSKHFPDWLGTAQVIDAGEAEIVSIYRVIKPCDRETLLKMARLLVPRQDVENDQYGT